MPTYTLTLLLLVLSTACSASSQRPAITTTPYQTAVSDTRQPTPSPFKKATPSPSPELKHFPMPSAFIPPILNTRRRVAQTQRASFTPAPSLSARPPQQTDVPMVDVPIPLPPYHTQIAMRDLHHIPAYTPPATETRPVDPITSPIIISPDIPLPSPQVTPFYESHRKYDGATNATTPNPNANGAPTETVPAIAVTSPIIISPYTPLAIPYASPLEYAQRKYTGSAAVTATPKASNMITATATSHPSPSPKALYTSHFTAVPLTVASHSGIPVVRHLRKRVIFRPLEMPRRNALPAHIYSYDRTARLIRAQNDVTNPSPSATPSLHFIDFGAFRSFAPLPSTGFISFGNRLAEMANTPKDQTGVSYDMEKPSPSPTYTPCSRQVGQTVFELPPISASTMPTIIPAVSPKHDGTLDNEPAITVNVRPKKVVYATMLVMPSMSPMKTADISWFTADAKNRVADTHQFIQSAVRHRNVKHHTVTPTPSRSRTSSDMEVGTSQTGRSYSGSDSDLSKPPRTKPSATPSPKHDTRAYEVRQAYSGRSDRASPSATPTPTNQQLHDVYGRYDAVPVASTGIYPLPQFSQPMYTVAPSSPMPTRFVYPSGLIGPAGVPSEFVRIAQTQQIEDSQNTPLYDPECEPVKQCLCAVVEREILTSELLQFCNGLDALTVAVCEQTRDTHLFFEFWRNKHDQRGLEIIRRCFPELEHLLML